MHDGTISAKYSSRYGGGKNAYYYIESEIRQKH
jgi:hypothetical protein